MPKRVLRVYVNPYTFIDHEGRPAGVFPHDPAYLPGQMHVGLSRVESTVTEKRDPTKDPRPSLTDRVHHYDAEIQEVPDVPGQNHYRQGIREGSLIPADEATAKAVGMKFEDPQAALTRARVKAVKDWTDAHGEPPAFAADEEAHAHVPTGLRGADKPATGTAYGFSDAGRGALPAATEAPRFIQDAAFPTDEKGENR